MELDENQLFALRVLVLRLRQTYSNEEIARLTEEATSPSLKSTQVQSYVIGRGGKDAQKAHVPGLLPIVIEQYQKRGWEKDLLLKAAFDILCETNDVAVSNAVNGELSEDLRDWVLLDHDTFRRTTDRVSGIWYLIRLASESVQDGKLGEAYFNISLLTIQPTRDIGTASLPVFSHYQRGKQMSKQEWQTYKGFLLVDPDRIYMIGKRSDNSRSLNAEMISFGYHGGEEAEGHLPEIRGQANSFSTRRQQIAAHHIGTFVEGSDKWEGDLFTEEKRRLREKIGVFTKREALLAELPIPEEVFDRLVEWSKEPVFTEK